MVRLKSPSKAIATSTLLLWIACSRASGFSVQPPSYSQKTITRTVVPSPVYSSNNNDFGEGVFYDDFDFPIGNDDDSTGSSFASNSLEDRMTELVATEQEIQAQISENWRQGHWSVRGCSLDPGDAGFGEARITISSILALEEDTILVGRTDGSLCWLQIGSEYLATFTSQLAAKESSNNTISVSRELQREDGASVPMPREDVSAPRADMTNQKFNILAQLPPASPSAIIDMVVLGDEETAMLFTLSDSASESIQQYQIREDGPVSSSSVSVSLPEGSSKIQAIRGLRNQNLLSVDETGLMNVWGVNAGGTSLQSVLQVPLEDDDMVLSYDVDSDFIYVGTALGYVMIFAVDQVVNLQGKQWPEPLKTITAFINAGVSAVSAAGDGVMGRGRSTPTIGLITGSTVGEIKQWELLPRGTDAVEYWPKMPSQKMPGKAHLLKDVRAQEAPVVALRAVQEGVVLSATPNQLATWDGTSGEILCTMEGMEFLNNQASCLVLSEHLLVTNGMKQYICIHDYSIDPDLNVKDMIVPMDDGDG